MLNHPDSMELTCPVSTAVPSGDVSVSVIHPLYFVLTPATFLSADSKPRLYTQGHPFQIIRLSPPAASSQVFSPPPCLTGTWPSQDFSWRATASSPRSCFRNQKNSSTSNEALFLQDSCRVAMSTFTDPHPHPLVIVGQDLM